MCDHGYVRISLLTALLPIACATTTAPAVKTPKTTAPNPPAAASGPCLTFKACSAACGTGAPCARLAEFYFYGWSGTNKDEAKAIALYLRACEGHDVTSCDLLFDLAEAGTDARKAAEARLRAVAAEECPKGDAAACLVLAELDFDRPLYCRACELGSIKACSMLTYKPVATDTDDTRPWLIRTSQLQKKACEAGDAEQCWSFGDKLRMMNNAMSGIPDPDGEADKLMGAPLSSAPAYFDRAIALWNTECAAGWVRACVDAGDALLDARPKPRQDDAVPFLRRACELHDEHACERLSH